MSYYDILLAKQLSGGGGGDITVESLSVTANGTYSAPSGKAYSPVVANVPNSYTASDEGKVVSSGALVAQTSQTIDTNGTYDTTLKNSVTVNVSGGGGGTTLLATKSLGHLQTTSTASVDTGQTVTATINNDYDFLIVVASVDTVPEPSSSGLIHVATARIVTLYNSTGLGTASGSASSATKVIKAKYNYGLVSSSEATAYGVYCTAPSIANGVITLPISMRYNVSSGGTVDNDYTVYVYGVKVFDYSN